VNALIFLSGVFDGVDLAGVDFIHAVDFIGVLSAHKDGANVWGLEDEALLLKERSPESKN